MGNYPAIAEFLILDRRMPRSLSFCAGQIVMSLTHLAEDYGDRVPSNDLADTLRARLKDRSIASIFEEGLHSFVSTLLNDTAGLAQQIEKDYRFIK
jgi:uncharacterized alpha-E superfamily protein